MFLNIFPLHAKSNSIYWKSQLFDILPSGYETVINFESKEILIWNGIFLNVAKFAILNVINNATSKMWQELSFSVYHLSIIIRYIAKAYVYDRC